MCPKPILMNNQLFSGIFSEKFCYPIGTYQVYAEASHPVVGATTRSRTLLHNPSEIILPSSLAATIQTQQIQEDVKVMVFPVFSSSAISAFDGKLLVFGSSGRCIYFYSTKSSGSQKGF